MKLDLRKLYAFKKLEIDTDLDLSKVDYRKLNIRKINRMHVKGLVKVNYEDNIELDLDIDGEVVMPCAITLEDVLVQINTHIEEEILENTLKDDFYLDLLDILWENVILEVPIRVTKEGAKLESQKGNGWEIVSE